MTSRLGWSPSIKALTASSWTISAPRLWARMSWISPSRVGPLGQMGRLGPLDLGPFHVGQPELGLLRPQRRLSDRRAEQETSDGDQPVGPVGGRVAGHQRGQGCATTASAAK